MWIGLMLPACAAADAPMPQAPAPQTAGPQTPGPQAMWQQSLGPQASGAEPIPAGQPAGPAVARPPAGGAESAGGVEDDGSSWYAGTFGPGCSPAPCCEICGGGSGPPPDYYVEGGPNVLSRGKPNVRTITFMRVSGDPNLPLAPGEETQQLSFKSVDPGICAGMLGTIGHYLGRDANDRDEFIEFTYWGLDRWQGTASIDSTEYIFFTSSGGEIITHSLYTAFPYPVGGFNRADEQTVSEQSSINNFELNYRFGPRNMPDQLVLHANGRWRRECRPGWYFSYLFGLRFVNINDAADLFSEGNYSPTPSIGDYNVHTRNRLLGCQLGGELTYRHCRWNVDLHGRAGPYLNFVRSEGSIVAQSGSDPDSSQDLNTQESKNRDTAAIVGEFGFAASYKFRPNLVARASYDFVWIGGLALAPEQFAFQTNPTPYVDNRGLLFINGVTVALEYTW
jgi:hypothetical protein